MTSAEAITELGKKGFVRLTVKDTRNLSNWLIGVREQAEINIFSDGNSLYLCRK